MEIIGRLDKIDLTDLELMDVEAKIDTGAYGCALHCHKIQLVEKDEQQTLKFQFKKRGKWYYYEAFSEKNVKSSTGISETRFVIKTSLVIFGKKQLVEFSLTDRSNMKFPILIGRKFLNKKYLVDVHQKNVSYQRKLTYLS